MDGMMRFPRRAAAGPRLGGSPPITSSHTGYPWVDGDILYAADLNAAFIPTIPPVNIHHPTDTSNAVKIAPFGASDPFVANTQQVSSYYETAASGGSGVVANINSSISIVGAPNAFLWSVLAIVDFDGTGGTGQHVPIYGQGIRRTYATGGNTNNPQIWAATLQTVDYTNTDSALTNALTSLEIDMNVGNTDSAGNRSLVTLALNKALETDVAPECHTGIGMYTESIDCHLGSALRIWVPYKDAALDFRTANEISGATIWFGNNAASIAWRGAGDVRTYWDGAALSGAGAVHFNGNVEVDGTLYAPNGEVVGGLATFISLGVSGTSTLGAIHFGTMPTNAANDAAAASAGVPVGTMYRNGSVLMVRVS